MRIQKKHPDEKLIVEPDKYDQAPHQEREINYRAILEKIPGITYMATFNEAMEFLYVSPQVEALTGFSPEELKTDPGIWSRQIHPGDRSRVLAQVAKCCSSQEKFNLDYRMLSRDGREVWLHDEAVIVRDDGGNPTHFLGVVCETTESKQGDDHFLKALSDSKQLEKEKSTFLESIGYFLKFPNFEEASPAIYNACKNLIGAELIRSNESLRHEIKERRRAEEKIKQHQRELRSMAAELSLVEERERREIATDIHDYLGQSLAAARIKLGLLRQSLGPDGLSADLDEAVMFVEEAIKYTQSLTFSLSLPTLSDIDFVKSVELLCSRFQERHGLRVTVESDSGRKRVAESTRIILFKAVRELLNNIVKHSGTKAARITVKRHNQKIRLTVEDDGVGFNPPESRFTDRGGFGLFSIRERIEHLGGSMRIESRPGRGTSVTLEAPLIKI